jgi:hypothetical protein
MTYRRRAGLRETVTLCAVIKLHGASRHESFFGIGVEGETKGSAASANIT